MTVIYQESVTLSQQFGLRWLLWSFRQQRLHVSSSTAQCTPYSFNKPLDLISTANLMSSTKNSATGCRPVVQPGTQKSNDTSRSLGLGELRHFFVRVWQGQKCLESPPRPTLSGMLSGLPSACRTNDTSLIFSEASTCISFCFNLERREFSLH